MKENFCTEVKRRKIKCKQGKIQRTGEEIQAYNEIIIFRSEPIIL